MSLPTPEETIVAEEQVELRKFQALLLEEKARLEREMESFHSDTGKPEGEGRKRTELGAADASASLSEREREMGYHDQLEGTLKEVDHALRRVDGGTYGLCELCAKPVNEARLEALPFAKLCIACQEKTEG
jgi:RNA polymerase-binding transcription factor DksA